MALAIYFYLFVFVVVIVGGGVFHSFRALLFICSFSHFFFCRLCRLSPCTNNNKNNINFEQFRSINKKNTTKNELLSQSDRFSRIAFEHMFVGAWCCYLFVLINVIQQLDSDTRWIQVADNLCWCWSLYRSLPR